MAVFITFALSSSNLRRDLEVKDKTKIQNKGQFEAMTSLQAPLLLIGQTQYSRGARPFWIRTPRLIVTAEIAAPISSVSAYVIMLCTYCARIEQRLKRPIGRFAGSNAAIKRPREIAFFSYDDEHNFLLDESSLRYYYPPKLPADLNRGFDTFKRRNDTDDEHLEAILGTIIALEKETGEKCEADIVTWRGMMTKVHLRLPLQKAVVRLKQTC
ncbi:Dom-3 Z [Ascosphaera aggregata]|nr:Dom-3 Z [Ascosphaera aggregata]